VHTPFNFFNNASHKRERVSYVYAYKFKVLPYHQKFSSYAHVYVSKGQPKVEALVNKFPNIFESGLGTMKCFQAHLYMKDEVKPKFCRPRPVPFAIKDGKGIRSLRGSRDCCKARL